MAQRKRSSNTTGKRTANSGKKGTVKTQKRSSGRVSKEEQERRRQRELARIKQRNQLTALILFALSIFIGIRPALKSKAEAFPPLSILLSKALHFLTQRRSLAIEPDRPLPAGRTDPNEPHYFHLNRNLLPNSQRS